MDSTTGMVDMSRPKPTNMVEEKAQMPVATDSYYEKYPWGLRLTLNDEDIKKLGLKISDFNVEDTRELTAKILVTSVSSEQNMNDSGKAKTRDRLEFQITDMSITDPEDFEGAFKEAIDE